MCMDAIRKKTDIGGRVFKYIFKTTAGNKISLFVTKKKESVVSCSNITHALIRRCSVNCLTFLGVFCAKLQIIYLK